MKEEPTGGSAGIDGVRQTLELDSVLLQLAYKVVFTTRICCGDSSSLRPPIRPGALAEGKLILTSMVLIRDLRENKAMNSTRLREATRTEHEAAESIMPLMQPGLTRELYTRVLCALLPIVSTWESWAVEAASTDLRYLLDCRQRTPLLTADLAALGMRVPGESSGVNWTRVIFGDGDEVRPTDADHRVALLLGGVYVMEGSTLGGRFLARHVEEKLALAPGHGSAYFRGYGESTGEMWREVKQRIEAVPDIWEAEVIAAARRTFVAFENALQDGLNGVYSPCS